MEDAGAAIFGIGFLIVWLAVMIFVIAGMWKVYTKAGKPGWACIVPIYNIIVLLEIVERPLWWFILYLIPLVNIVILFIVMMDLAKAFGKGAGFGLGLFLLSPVFLPILGFSDAQYEGV